MAAVSGLIRVMERAARKAGGRLRRDFGEVAHLQVSRKGPSDFVSKADQASERTLRDELRAARPVVAGPLQSYELWVIPEGGAPISLAVLGQLDGTLRVPEGHVERLRKGALLAISVEPAGGSPTGAPTGPVILSGAIS